MNCRPVVTSASPWLRSIGGPPSVQQRAHRRSYSGGRTRNGESRAPANAPQATCLNAGHLALGCAERSRSYARKRVACWTPMWCEYQEVEARFAQQLIDALGNERYEEWRAAGAALGLGEALELARSLARSRLRPPRQATFPLTRASERHAAGSWRSPWKTASTLFPSGSMTNAA